MKRKRSGMNVAAYHHAEKCPTLVYFPASKGTFDSCVWL